MRRTMSDADTDLAAELRAAADGIVHDGVHATADLLRRAAARVAELEAFQAGVAAIVGHPEDSLNTPEELLAQVELLKKSREVLSLSVVARERDALRARVAELEGENASMRREILAAGNGDFDWSVLGRLDSLDAALAFVETQAEERHLSHGRIGEAFWGCSRPCCKAAAAFLRGEPSWLSKQLDAALASVAELEAAASPAARPAAPPGITAGRLECIRYGLARNRHNSNPAYAWVAELLDEVDRLRAAVDDGRGRVFKGRG